MFIERNGETYALRDEHGKTRYLQQFPQISIANKLAGQLLRLEQEFGMTPSARSRIELSASNYGDDYDELDEFLRNGA